MSSPLALILACLPRRSRRSCPSLTKAGPFEPIVPHCARAPAGDCHPSPSAF
ncbi:hypothetical protein BF49_1852 [Bradyrhizobium sp.]|nr:hypothetical protein BF49_1852 [Bradyrhizobium sp.]